MAFRQAESLLHRTGEMPQKWCVISHSFICKAGLRCLSRIGFFINLLIYKSYAVFKRIP